MSAGKTNKSFSKRLRLTKGGKILSRKSGQDHFNAKESGRKSLHRSDKFRTVNMINKKVVEHYIPSR